MARFANALVLCAAPVVLLGCSDSPERPNADGYTLNGFVRDSYTSVPVSEVTVRLRIDPDPEFHDFAVTDSGGTFLFQPSPATAPNSEIFRFEKTGYFPVEVPSRTATRAGPYRYRLEVELEQEPVL